jgi:hypothetical protein
MIPPSLLVISQGWGLIDLPLRASNEGLLRPRVARAQKDHQAPSPPLFWEHRINVGGLHPFYRGSSASKEDGPSALLS